jgi:hypothetical protein
MLTKNLLIEDLRQTLTHILCQDLDEEDAADMRSSIEDFLAQRANQYSAQDLIHNFDSAEKILDQFISHLETRREMAGRTLH